MRQRRGQSPALRGTTCAAICVRREPECIAPVLAGYGVTSSSMRRDSKDVAVSHLHIAVAAAKTLRRHTLRLLLRQQRRSDVTLAHCCCGSRDVAASPSQSAVAAAETLRRRTRRLLLRQQRPCNVTLCDHCSGSTASAVVVDMSNQFLRRSQHRACVGAHWAHAGHTSLAAAASSDCLR